MSNAPITVVMLTYNEEIHIERCIRSLQPIASRIFIVDSFSSDRTVELAQALGAEVIQRKWKNYADQFQWGLDNCGAVTGWIIRMDADEYLEPELQDEIRNFLVEEDDDDVDGIYVNRKHFFYNKWIRHGGRYPLTLLRIWRTGKGRIEQRWMDEHIVLSEGSKTIQFKGNIVDANLKGIGFFITKHNSYATREAIDILNNKYDLYQKDESIKVINDPQAKWKRKIKDRIYSRLPIWLRSVIYFLFRYVIQLGFLDGWKGFVYHFMQGFWYRLLVDMKVYEIEVSSKGYLTEMMIILKEEHGIDLS